MKLSKISAVISTAAFVFSAFVPAVSAQGGTVVGTIGPCATMTTQDIFLPANNATSFNESYHISTCSRNIETVTVRWTDVTVLPVDMLPCNYGTFTTDPIVLKPGDTNRGFNVQEQVVCPTTVPRDFFGEVLDQSGNVLTSAHFMVFTQSPRLL